MKLAFFVTFALRGFQFDGLDLDFDENTMAPT